MLKYFVICLLAVSCKGAPISSESQDDDAAALNLIKATGNEKNILPDEECQRSNLKVAFELYTRERPSKYEIDLDNFNTTKFSAFNIKRTTEIYIHDWLQNTSNSQARDMVAAYLRDNDEPVNVILVNYASVSCCRYKQVRDMQPDIAKEVSRHIKQLVKFGALPGKIHIIGLGMGAQIAGLTATNMRPAKIGRLTALDPTFIAYSEANPQLNNEDVEFLDVINTAQRKFQSVKHLGHIRFYPNEGTSQPAASGLNSGVGGAISHLMAAQYFLESILQQARFEATKCDSYLNYNLGKCSQNPTTVMGEHVNRKLYGNYYLKTRAVPPFALGAVNDASSLVLQVPVVEDVIRVNAPKEVSKEKLVLVTQRYQQYKLKLQEEEKQQAQQNQEKYQKLIKQNQEEQQQNQGHSENQGQQQNQRYGQRLNKHQQHQQYQQQHQQQQQQQQNEQQ